ncbi:MAG: TonB-dependent receptor [Mangrovibacterium sp.]
MEKKGIKPVAGFPIHKKFMLTMRLTLLLMLVAVFSVNASTYAQKTKLDLNFKDQQIRKILNQIENQSEFTFMYDNSRIDVERKVSLDVKSSTITETLEKIFQGTDVSYKIMGRHIMLFTNGESVSSQQKEITVSGRVTDSGGVPLPGVSIVIKGTTMWIITDADGLYSLKNIPEKCVLVFSFIGMKSQEISYSGESTVNMVMESENIGIDEVVVVGFGTQKKVNLTGAVATVDTKVLDSRPVTSVSQALQGTVPGLNFTTPSLGGQLGQSMNVDIRGTGTISTGSYASTLILIDGIEGNMNNLNPDDIESISVLKDAAAAAIYGSRAAFGVILITTKKGKAGTAQVTYSNNFRYSGPTNLPNLMNSYNFANFFNEASLNGGGSIIFDDDTMDRIQKYMNGEITTPTVPNEGNGNWQFHEKANDNVDWYKIHYKWSWSKEHSININGGTDKVRYYASAKYLDQEGNLRYGDDRFKRFNAMSNVSAKVNKYIDMNLNVKFIRTELDNPYYSDMGGLLYHDIVRIWPMMPFKDPNGYYMRNGKLIQLTNGSRAITHNDNLYAQAQIIAHPAKNWNIYGEAGMRVVNENKQSNLNTVYEHNVKGDPLLLQYDGSHAAGATGAYQTFVNQNMYTTSLYSDYAFNLEDHHFKLMAGMNTEEFKYRDLGAERPDLYTETILEIKAASGTDKITSAGVFDWATAGFFGRLNYDYQEKYLFEANVRYDGSSRFLRDQRWATFPSFSFGWNIARENFFQEYTGVINTLKPRISWGKLGNQNTNSYYPFYLTQTVSVKGGNWLMNGLKPTVAGAPGTVSSKLTWESIKSTNIGFDLAMLKNRLSVNFDYFNRITEDMVGPAAEVGAVYGITLPSTNNATLENRGWELALTWRDKIDDVNYHVAFNLSDNQVKVTSYPNASYSLSTYYNGMELGEIWGYETEGIARSKEEMDAWLANNNPTWGSNWGEGDIMYRDLDGDKIVSIGSNTLTDPGDQRVIGNSSPRYRFGLSMGADWKGFDFFVFLQGVAKRDLWLGDPNFWGVGSGEWQSTGLDEHLDYYRPENTTSVFGSNTDAYYPKIYLSKTMNQQVQTRYLQNGAYIRLKNIQMGYNFPKIILDKVGLQGLRIYCSAENILTLSHIAKMYDPEATNGPWGNGKTYPLSSTISFGAKVTF